jgi:uncharacterized membrane protein YeaQ/YmgE (transglycosylase-associated protein family)
MGILSWILPGLIVGFIARIAVPTGRKLGCLGTILLGVMGSFVGGSISSLMSDDGFDIQRSEWVGSIIGAVVILVLIRFSDSRSDQ